jgi:hypothetical protein
MLIDRLTVPVSLCSVLHAYTWHMHALFKAEPEEVCVCHMPYYECKALNHNHRLDLFNEPVFAIRVSEKLGPRSP